MKLSYFSLVAMIPAALLRAGTDSAFDATLRQIRNNMPRCEETESTAIELPASSISLAESAKVYQCWQLLLTSQHGKQVLKLMQQLKSIQTSLVELKAKLAKDIELYSASGKSDSTLQQRIISEDNSLESLLASYKTLTETGESHDLLHKVEKVFLRDHPALIPKIRNDDYSMVYDDSTPECRTRSQEQ